VQSFTTYAEAQPQLHCNKSSLLLKTKSYAFNCRGTPAQPAATSGRHAAAAHPRHFLSLSALLGSVQQLQKKLKQQHSRMKRRMRSE
jgi:hypothetical protein